MRVLITGASGVVGQAVIANLSQLPNAQVFGLAGKSDVDLENLTETRAVFRYLKPDHVIHLAGAVFGLGGNMAFPADSFRRNLMMNTHAIEASREIAVKKFIAMGTAAIYSDEATLPFSEIDALTGQPHGSEFAYASAKRAMLVHLEACLEQYGMNYAYAISTNVYGPHDRFDHRFGHVVPSLIEKFATASKAGTIVEIWGDGSPSRDLIFSEDAARGLVTMLKTGNGRYNLATGTTHTIKELVQVISTHFPGVKYEWNASKPSGQLSRKYDVNRIAALGFQPQHSLETGIASTVNWYMSNQGNSRRYAID